MNVYKRGAQDGLIIGAILSVTFLLQAWMLRAPMLGMLASVALLSVPFVAYYLIYRTYRGDEGRSTFSALWMQGIMMFLCGALIMGLVVCLYVRFVAPTFISDQLHQAAVAYSQLDNATATQLADIFEQMANTPRLQPTAVQLAFGIIWTVGFFGTMTSLILAAIIKYIVKYRK